MRLINKKALVKLQRKNRGNVPLANAIDKLIEDIEENQWESQKDLLNIRADADCVHNDGFYFFNIHIHRTMILIEFGEGEATIVWAGTHQEYNTIFKNNKHTIRKWLSAKDWI